MPEALAALATARLRSRSIARCASILPACALDVPRAEMNIVGVGDIDEAFSTHFEESGSMMGVILLFGTFGARRAMV